MSALAKFVNVNVMMKITNQPNSDEVNRHMILVNKMVLAINSIPDKEVRDLIWHLIDNSRINRK
jgi:hypothetical protein